MKTRGQEESNLPDLLSTPYSDKSHRAAALDDRLSRCTKPFQCSLPKARSYEGNAALHLTLWSINTAGSADAHSRQLFDVRK